MKSKYYILPLLILLTSCYDNSNILSSKNIASSNDVKNFDSKLTNDALVNNGYYELNSTLTSIGADLLTEIKTYITTKMKFSIELNENHEFVIKDAIGTLTYINFDTNQITNYTFNSKEGNSYIKEENEDKILYQLIPSSIPTIIQLPYQCAYNLEHAINFYSYPIPTTYINDNQIYIQENYRIRDEESNGYLSAIYTNSYKSLQNLEMDTIFYPFMSYKQTGLKFRMSLKSIDSFTSSEIKDIDKYSLTTNIKNYKISIGQFVK